MSQQLELLSENSSQWTTFAFVIPEINIKEILPFLLLALNELEGNPSSRTSSVLNKDKFAAVRAVVRHFARYRSAIKGPWNREDAKTFLEGLRFSPRCVSELSGLLCTEKIFERIPSHLRLRPGLVSLQWKIDMSLSQSNIQAENANPHRSKEIMRRDTRVILVLKLTNGQKKVYRLTVNKFHELRYVIASALKSMIVLERRKCMKKD